jgi:hypothetical protein
MADVVDADVLAVAARDDEVAIGSVVDARVRAGLPSEVLVVHLILRLLLVSLSSAGF